jgi:hypothetical protein
MRKSLLGLLLASISVPAFAFNPDCFCVRKNDGKTVKFATAACEDERYPDTGAPWENGIKQCTTAGAPVPKVSDANIRRCFCARHLGGNGIEPYRVYKMELPECKGLSYKPDGRETWDRVLNCDAWNSCHKADTQCQAKMKQLTLNITRNPQNAMRSTTALQTQAVKCQSITDDCWVKGLK